MTDPSPSVIYKPASYLDPLDWRDVFGRVAPLEIDVGCGKGFRRLRRDERRHQFERVGPLSGVGEDEYRAKEVR